MNDIPGNWGTAVNVQEMVYGNMGNTSGTGVAFTRNPATGENKLYGEFLMNAQGEDVVAGIRTPQTIDQLRRCHAGCLRAVRQDRRDAGKHYKDMQDMEFTIERGKLFMLQTRNGKRTAAAALKVAVDLVGEGMITKPGSPDEDRSEAAGRLAAPDLRAGRPQGGQSRSPKACRHRRAPPAARSTFDADDATEASDRGEKVILVRLETSPEDIQGMNVSQGILTGRGGMTSHAAVVARGMGKCCVSGCSDLSISEAEKYFLTKDGQRFSEGDWLSLDGINRPGLCRSDPDRGRQHVR